jgi:peptide deformylase
VKRPEQITIEYLNEDFEPVTETYKGFAARVVQHEYDHIEGILFIDHLSALKKRLLKSKLTKMSRGEVPVDYKILTPVPLLKGRRR